MGRGGSKFDFKIKIKNQSNINDSIHPILSRRSEFRNFAEMKHPSVHGLRIIVLGNPLDANYKPMSLYSGKPIGIEYFYNKKGDTADIVYLDKENKD